MPIGNLDAAPRGGASDGTLPTLTTSARSAAPFATCPNLRAWPRGWLDAGRLPLELSGIAHAFIDPTLWYPEATGWAKTVLSQVRLHVKMISARVLTNNTLHVGDGLEQLVIILGPAGDTHARSFSFRYMILSRLAGLKYTTAVDALIRAGNTPGEMSQTM